MVPKLLRSGQSFKGLSDYLSHDSNKAQTSKRVAWTHTLNCTNDDVSLAVHEMYTTQLDADALKQEAGVPGGGRRVSKPVKHVSLNWHRDDAPEKEHMIATSQAFLQHMGWQEHQAVIYCHTDRHPHVHIMLNAIHPETGKALNTSHDYRRAQAWALEYEQAQEQIRCEQRLKDPAEREDSLTREAWLTMKEGEETHLKNEKARRDYDADYMARLNVREDRETQEWRLLKAHQREEREAFFAQGKQAYAQVRQAVYRDMREEFKKDWDGFYSFARNGVDPDYLRELKDGILQQQRSLLQETRDEAYAELRGARDTEYEQILLAQQEARHELHERQEQGLSSPGLLDLVNAPPLIDVHAEFGAAAEEVTRRDDDPLTFGGAAVYEPQQEKARESSSESRRDIAADGASAGIAALTGGVEKLFDGFFGSGPPKRQPPPARDPNPFARTAEKAIHKAMEEEQQKRDRDYWDDRDRSRD